MENPNLTQARNLYFNTTLTQAQIAEHIGVSQKTISLYISQNNWKLLKRRVQTLPTLFVEQMNSELQELNTRIASRPEGKRIPTSKEADLRRKILYSLVSVKKSSSVGNHIEAYIDLAKYIAGRNRQHAHLLCSYSREFLEQELQMPAGGAYVFDALSAHPELDTDDDDDDDDDSMFEGDDGYIINDRAKSRYL